MGSPFNLRDDLIPEAYAPAKTRCNHCFNNTRNLLADFHFDALVPSEGREGDMVTAVLRLSPGYVARVMYCTSHRELMMVMRCSGWKDICRNATNGGGGLLVTLCFPACR
jgi:hypothetical protein